VSHARAALKVSHTRLRGVLRIEPERFRDDRGHFTETFNVSRYADIGIVDTFVQDNVTRSHRGVLRGIHFQFPHAQAKLVSVLEGEVFDVAVDIRRGSPTFRHWHGEYLSADNNRQLYIPRGFGHAFVVTSNEAVFAYKCSEYDRPESEHTLRWNDPRLAIEWPLSSVDLSARDRAAATIDVFPEPMLPPYAE
jgi:dTDP-4-dehydrorhamnose 3,5-epimerase